MKQTKTAPEHGARVDAGPKGARRGIDSVATAGKILQAMLRLGSVFRLKDLEIETGIASATLYRYLVSLTDCGLVQRADASNRYTLGLLAFQLGQQIGQGKDVASLIAPQVQEFSERTGETCAIGLWFEQGPAIVKWFEVNHSVAISLRLGASLPLLRSSTAKVFAAHLPRETTEPLIRTELKSEHRPLSAMAAGYREYQHIRRIGLAQALASHVAGINSLSAPVFDQNGRIVLAISVVGNQATFSADLAGPIAIGLRDLAQRLSAFLGNKSTPAS